MDKISMKINTKAWPNVSGDEPLKFRLEQVS